MKVPIAVLGAEFDQVSPPELLKQFEEAMNAKRPKVHYVHCHYFNVKHARSSIPGSCCCVGKDGIPLT